MLNNFISTIEATIKSYGQQSIDIMVLDKNKNFHIARYNRFTNDVSHKFVNVHTGQAITDPVLWDYLPKISDAYFETAMAFNQQ